MHIIKIKKPDLIEELAAALLTAGSNNWDVYINIEGDISTRHITDNNSDWFEFLDLCSCCFEDNNGLFPGDDGYDYKEAADWMVYECNDFPTEIEYRDEKDRDLKTAAIELV